MAVRGKTHTYKNFKFRSKLEYEFYILLERAGIGVRTEVMIPLSPPSVHKSKTIRLLRDRGADQVVMYVDFVFELDGITHYVDTKPVKGVIEDKSIVKYTLLKHKLLLDGLGDTSEIRFVYSKDISRLSNIVKYQPKLLIPEFLKIKLF